MKKILSIGLLALLGINIFAGTYHLVNLSHYGTGKEDFKIYESDYEHGFSARQIYVDLDAYSIKNSNVNLYLTIRANNQPEILQYNVWANEDQQADWSGTPGWVYMRKDNVNWSIREIYWGFNYIGTGYGWVHLMVRE